MRIFILSCLVFLVSSPVLAQSRANIMYGVDRASQMLELNTKKYFQYLDVVKDNVSSRTDLYALYVTYPKTEQYDPFATKVIRALEMNAFKVDTSEDLVEVNNAIVAYNKLLDKHIVNLGVLEFALKMANVNRSLGNEIYLRKLHAMLIDIIDRPIWNGLSPEKAFKVISYGEENFFLSKHNVTVKGSELYTVGDRFYNVHDCEDENGEYLQLYVDVTTPIRQVESLRELEEKSPDLADLPPVQ